MEIDSLDVNLNLGIFSLGGKLKLEKEVIDAAWELYVELVTRVMLSDIDQFYGSVEEALDSYYSIFNKTRDILKKFGPNLAKKESDEISLAMIAISILNYVLRPFLSYWHPLLVDYESTREKSVSIISHEKKWPEYENFIFKMKEVRKDLKLYADLLSEILQIKRLHEDLNFDQGTNT